MSRPPNLSVTIITRNEERNLPELLARLAWVDEIVIVDGGSRDRTVELARAAGARVIEHRFVDFATQRNHALSAARGRWVWSIDCDERPTPQLCDEIRSVIGRERHNGYRIRIRSTIFGRPMRFGGTQDDRPIRLVRRGAAHWTGGVHEVLCVRGVVGELRGVLHHHTLADLHAFLRKMNHYTTLGAEARLLDGRAPRHVDLCWPPVREVARRLVWKLGLLDGPKGWAFAGLSGLSEWVLARKHRQLWLAAHRSPKRDRIKSPLSQSRTSSARHVRDEFCRTGRAKLGDLPGAGTAQ